MSAFYLSSTPHFEQNLGLIVFPRYLSQAGHLQFLNENIIHPIAKTMIIPAYAYMGMDPRTSSLVSSAIIKGMRRMIIGMAIISCLRRFVANWLLNSCFCWSVYSIINFPPFLILRHPGFGVSIDSKTISFLCFFLGAFALLVFRIIMENHEHLLISI